MMNFTDIYATHYEKVSISTEQIRRLFQNQIQLWEAFFYKQIDTTFNRIDDKFHGDWNAFRRYDLGDIDVYKHTLWKMPKSLTFCGKNPDPFALNVHRLVQALTDYQVTNTDYIDRNTELKLTGVLKKLKQFNPLNYAWTKTSDFKAVSKQIGLRANELQNVFPQVLEIGNDFSSVAYQILVQLLVQSYNELTQQEQDNYDLPDD